MKVEIKVPAMGESITEATVGAILKPSGSPVAMDDEVLELETDKVNQVLYAPQGGTLTLSVRTDDVVTIGQVIGYVDTEGAAPAEEPKKVEESEPKPKPSPKPEPKPEPAPPKPQPVSEGGARLSRDDFLKEAVPPKPTPEPSKAPSERRETRTRMSKVRQVIASRLVEAQQTTAMLTTFNEVDLSEVIALRAKYKDSFQKEHGSKLGFMSFFVKASVAALQAFPEINSYIEGNEIVHREYYDIGIAVGTDRGLFVPVVRGCDQLSFAEIEGAIVSYAKKAQEGKLAVGDLQGGGFTITNGGIYGSLLSTPIINPPQSGILGMHSIQKRPVVENDEIVIRPMMYIAMSYDHRIVDGKGAVSFLVHLKNSLEDPARLLLDI